MYDQQDMSPEQSYQPIDALRDTNPNMGDGAVEVTHKREYTIDMAVNRLEQAQVAIDFDKPQGFAPQAETDYDAAVEQRILEIQSRAKEYAAPSVSTESTAPVDEQKQHFDNMAEEINRHRAVSDSDFSLGA